MIELDIKKDGLASDLKNTNELVKSVIGNIFSKLEIALNKTDKSDKNRIARIKERIVSCISLLENPLLLSGVITSKGEFK